MLYTSLVIIIKDSELFGELVVKKLLELYRKVLSTFVVVETLFTPFFCVGNSESDERRGTYAQKHFWRQENLSTVNITNTALPI